MLFGSLPISNVFSHVQQSELAFDDAKNLDY